MTNRNIIIYRDQLLSLSETFIKTQSLALNNYTAHFVGSRLLNGIDLPKDKTFVIRNSNSIIERSKEILFKITLNSPKTLVKQLTIVEPRLLHAHFAFDGIFALPIAEALDIPIVITLHGYDVTITDKFWLKSNNYLCRQFPKRRLKLVESERVSFIAVSEHIKERAISQGYPEDKIMVHYIGVDTDRFRPSGYLCSEPVVLFVGRLVEKKGCIYLLRAMRIVQDHFHNARLIIVGDGVLRSELERETRKLFLNATFLGSRDNNFVREQIHAARIICVPSITSSTGDSEGLPIFLLEAMAMGKAIVASHTAGIPEVIRDGITGLISPEKDGLSLANNIIDLVKSDTLCKKLGLEARRYVEVNLSTTKQTQELENIYSKLS